MSTLTCKLSLAVPVSLSYFSMSLVKAGPLEVRPCSTLAWPQNTRFRALLGQDTLKLGWGTLAETPTSFGVKSQGAPK